MLLCRWPFTGRTIAVGFKRSATYSIKSPIGLSTVQKQVIDDILDEGIPRSQAQLARRIGRTRASVHSAVKVLRRRGILRQDVLNLASHIQIDIFRRTDRLTYQWNDGRRVQA